MSIMHRMEQEGNIRYCYSLIISEYNKEIKIIHNNQKRLLISQLKIRRYLADGEVSIIRSYDNKH